MGVKRVVIDGARYVDVPLDLRTGEPRADLPLHLRDIARVSSTAVATYLQVASRQPA